jgi:imidazole glycerol-phosphate synthase subunit HisF
MRSRVIPVLLMDANKRLVKTVRFGARTYIGDPFNVIRIFNEKEVDELCVLDIDATSQHRGPDFDFLRQLSSECFMPLAYGGGIRSAEDCEKLNALGVEKFVIGSAANQPGFVRSLANQFGSQAIIGCVDVRDEGARGTCVVHSGSQKIGLDPDEYSLFLQGEGVGEILLQSVDRDGARTGYDLSLIRRIAHKLSVPLIAIGGAGGIEDLVEAFRAGASAAASGSAFCFIGRLRAVLISYPTSTEIMARWNGSAAS